MEQRMSLEQFKSAVAESLSKSVGATEAAKYMAAYEKDFPQFYAENWSVAALTAGLLSGI